MLKGNEGGPHPNDEEAVPHLLEHDREPVLQVGREARGRVVHGLRWLHRVRRRWGNEVACFQPSASGVEERYVQR